MAIYIRCTKCKCDHTLGHKVCRKCGSALGIKKKYKVVVKTPKGNRVIRLVDTLSLAKRVENSFKGKIAEKRLLGVTKAPLISDIWDKYLVWAKKHKKSWYDDKTRWEKHIGKKVAEKRMDQLIAHDVENILDGMVKDEKDLTKKHAPATIKQVLVLIKRVYNWANDQDLYDGRNPAAKIEPPKVENEVTECLSESEIENLLKIIENWKFPLNALVVKFALYTGFRRGEILKLEWKDIDLDGDFVSLRDPKGKPAKIPIGKEAVKILHRAKDLSPYDGYLRLILGISMNKRMLSVEEQNRLDLAVALISFIAKYTPRKTAMAGFIREYASDNAVSKSFCYKIKTRLQDLTVIKWDDHWQEYQLNMERYKRDRKALRGFKGQIKKWQG